MLYLKFLTCFIVLSSRYFPEYIISEHSVLPWD